MTDVRTRLPWALMAAVAVGVLPAVLTGPGTDLTGALQLGTGSLLTVLPILFLAGVLTSLTPCVYPLIPITVSIFGAGKRKTSRGQAALLSATYVAGIATMYSLLGVAAAASGKAFGSFMGNPVVMAGFALVLVAFALSMFGLYEISLPSSLQTRLSQVRGIGPGGAFAMGLVAGVIAAPCTGPVLGAVLTWVASTRDLALGFWLLFTYALGMGLLFFVLGTFSVSLPKSGGWMEAVKTVLGVALVVVALGFVRPFLPEAIASGIGGTVLAVVAAVLTGVAIVGGALHLSFHGPGTEKLLKTAGLVVTIAALALRFEWIVDADAATVVATNTPGTGTEPAAAPAKIAWKKDHAEALAAAKSQGKHLIIDFYADWCVACGELDKHTFSDPRVKQLVSDKFVALKVDGTEETEAVLALQQQYGVVGLPVVAVVAPDGTQLKDPRVTGFIKAEEMLVELAKVK